MKVIKKGKEPKAWTAKRTCTGKGSGLKGCGAKLLLSPEDLYNTFKSTDGETTTQFITFTCPLCKAETDMGVNGDLPYDVQGVINKSKKSKENFKQL